MVAQSTIQPAFNSGEWAPSLYSRVDLAKWRTGAALLENFFVDYRGGASTRAGTKWCLQAKNSDHPVRLIPFQASSEVGYALEFGEGYIRFFVDGEPVLESSFAITDASQTDPCVIEVTGNNYAVGDWVYIAAVVGMTQLNGRYFIVSAVSGADVTLTDLFGADVDATGYGAYTSGGTVQRVYTITSPYAGTDLFNIKFVQQVSSLILCHPSFDPYILTLNTATSWSLAAIAIGSTVGQTSSLAITTTLSAGNFNYSYAVCAVDEHGQEGPAVLAALASREDLRTVAGTNIATWAAVPGALSYNVYKSELRRDAAVPTGSMHGYIGNATGVDFIDSNIAPDFSVTPPVAKNPFVGGNVLYATVTTQGTYASIPTITFTGSATVEATGLVTLTVTLAAVNANGTDYQVGDRVYFRYGIIVEVVTVNGSGGVTSLLLINGGALSSGSVPGTSGSQSSTTGDGTGFNLNLTWGVSSIQITEAGYGYAAAPTIAFSAGTAAATATISDLNVGFPTVPSFYNQRLWLMGRSNSPQGFNASQPGAYYNFDTYNPVQADSAISGTLVSGILNTIRAAIPMQNGLVVFSDRMSWVINGGSSGAGVSATDIVANPQAYNGISNVPPIVANGDILYVQAKGSIVRNLAYNFYTNNYIGTDVSAISSHLFFGYRIIDWAWAEEPFKIAWGVRDDGTLLSFTFLREQEFMAWAHSTTNGSFKSICSVVEGTGVGDVDAIYVAVERTVNGQTLKYIERMAERVYPNGLEDAWCVDSGLRYDSTPATTFTGMEHLTGEDIVGLADGVPFTATVSATGSFTLASAASVVVAGLSYTCKLKTLPIDLGEPTAQGKVKKIPAVDVRVNETLGLKIGQDFDHLVSMKDLVDGAVGSMLTGLNPPLQQVDGLYSGDARTIIGPAYTVMGQYCIQQDLPYPASILGVIPQVVIGDTKDPRQ